MKILRRIVAIIILILFPLSAVFADIDSFIKPLLPGDIIFCKGVIASGASSMLSAPALHGHLSIYLGRKEDLSKFLRKDQVEKCLTNWTLGDYDPFGRLREDSIIVYDIYPDPIYKGTNVRFLDIGSEFFKDASAQRYPIALSKKQRQKILQFIFDNIDIKFDHKGITDTEDNLWTCWEMCEVAYSRAGVSFLEYMGLNLNILSAIEIPVLCEKGNAMLRQTMAFYITDFAAVEISNNFTEQSVIKYYAVHLSKEYSPKKLVSIIRIRHDKRIVDLFSGMFGFKEVIAGPFNSEEETLKFISLNWDKNYPGYLAKLKAG